MPTGSETGTGTPMPETVDEGAVAALEVTPDELREVPGDRGDLHPGGARGEPATDLGRGLDRELGSARGRDRVAIPRDELPPPELVRSRPVSRMYRALVDEYFRRPEELAGER